MSNIIGIIKLNAWVLSLNAMPLTSPLSTSRHLNCLRGSASLKSQGRLFQRMTYVVLVYMSNSNSQKKVF